MNNPNKILFIDIETVPKYKNLEEMENVDKFLYNMFLTKFEKSNSDLNFKEFYIKKASVIPTYGKIVCLTLAYYTDNKLTIKSFYGNEEQEILEESYLGINNASKMQYQLCGYYIKNFDIPWINLKMLKYGLKVPGLISTINKKPWEINAFDIYDELKSNYWTLSELCYELNIKTPDFKGSEVYDFYYKENNLKDIVIHCETDVKATVDLYNYIYNNQK
jgi:predicted PolB exonuclease-like 3'-5' exonuclease